MKTKKQKYTAAGRKIIAGLQEIVEAREAGVPLTERFVVRVVNVPEPRKYDAAGVRTIRQKLGVSQNVFARIVGVSTILAQSWEQGRRIPSPLARRLLDEINRDVEHWTSMLRKSA